MKGRYKFDTSRQGKGEAQSYNENACNPELRGDTMANNCSKGTFIRMTTLYQISSIYIHAYFMKGDLAFFKTAHDDWIRLGHMVFMEINYRNIIQAPFFLVSIAMLSTISCKHIYIARKAKIASYHYWID